MRDKDAWVKRILEWYNPKYKISYIKWHKYGNYYPQRVDTLGELEYFYEQYQSDIYKYFEDKKSQYKKLRGVDLEVQAPEKEYTLTQGEADEWDPTTIDRSFKPAYDQNNPMGYTGGY